MTYQFFPGEQDLSFRVSVLTGVNRSGKTLLGKLIGSTPHVEHIDEPWLPMMLPIMQGVNHLSRELARDMLVACTDELFNDIILLRQSNFRPGDESSIWTVKEPVEIAHRLLGLETREDVRAHVKHHDSMLLYNLGGTLPFCDFISQALTGCKIVHVVRHGYDVAAAVAEKGWWSNESLRVARVRCLYRPFDDAATRFYIPWWIKQDEEKYFLDLGDFAKGLYFWVRLMEINSDQIDELRDRHQDRFKEVKFGDIVARPVPTVEEVGEFLGVSPSAQTKKVIETINPRVLEDSNQGTAVDLPCDLRLRATGWLERYGYESRQ